MNKKTAASARFKRILLFHRDTIWFSELAAAIVVTVLLCALLWISGTIIYNAISIVRNEQKIASIKTEKIYSFHEMEDLAVKARITSVLRCFARRYINDHTIQIVADIVCKNSRRFGYDPLLLLAVIRQESIFNPLARGKFISGNSSGAFGLMQLRFKTAEEVARQLEMPPITEEDLLNPEINMVLGVSYLTTLISNFRSFKLGLLAYNQGPGIIRKTLSNQDTLSIDYYQRVLTSYYHLKKLEESL